MKPSQQTPPGNRGRLLLSAGPVTNTTDASAATAAKRAPGRATLPGNTSKHRCVQGHRGEFLPKGAQIPPWRFGWTRRKAADRRKTSGIKPTPVSDSEEQAAPGRDRDRRSGETRGRVAGAGSQRRGSNAAAPPILAPPHLPAPPPGRRTPGAGPAQRPHEPCPALRRRGTAPAPVHPGACGPEASQHTSLEPRRLQLPACRARAPPLRATTAGPRSRARLSLSLRRPREGACAIRGPRARTHPVIVVVRLHEMPVARLVMAEVGLLADQQVPGHLAQPAQRGHALPAQTLPARLAPPLSSPRPPPAGVRSERRAHVRRRPG